MEERKEETESNLVGTQHVLIEDVHGDLDESGVSDPAGEDREAIIKTRQSGRGERRTERNLSQTHVPSCPAVTSRTLSALTLAVTASLALGSFLMGI